MKRLTSMLSVLLAASIGAGIASGLATGAVQDAAVPAQDTTAVERFVTCDLFVDAGTTSLGAYQLTFEMPEGVRLVGIYGGESEAFAAPPAYDPRALQSDRVILAAFAAEGAAVPSGETRVASLALYTTTDKTDWTVTLAAAADGQAERITAAVEARLAPSGTTEEPETGDRR